MTSNPITPTIPLDQPGAHHGFLRLPYSRDDSAWGSVMIPITVINGGDGPTALLTGGNHGDEYEGPIALQELAATLDPAQVTGRLIILPMMNQPAFAAGRRCSPIDGGNMNRSFPGRPDGTVTQKIAHYIATELVPLADVVLDFHSGGRTLDFLPFAAAHILPDKAQEAACMAAIGLRSLSMRPASIGPVKSLLMRYSLTEIRDVIEESRVRGEQSVRQAVMEYLRDSS